MYPSRVCSFLVNNSKLGESQEKSPICRLRLRVCERLLLIAVGCDQSGGREFCSFKNAGISRRTADADISARKRVKVGCHLLARRLNPANSNHKNNSRQACDGRSCRTDELQHLERLLCQLTVELRERLRAARSLKHCP